MGESKKIHAQLLVVGGGPGGYTAAFRAADLGLDVVLIDERSVLGGVCLNEGCIPSKALLDTVKKLSDIDVVARRGFQFEACAFDLDSLRGWKDAIVADLNKGLDTLAAKRGVRVINGRGVFSNRETLCVDGGLNISFDKVILAVGSRPRTLPCLPHDPRIIDSRKALELKEVPARLLIVGGGVIGVEMATIYAGLGSRVTIAELGSKLIPGCDADLVKPLFNRLLHSTDSILLNTSVVGASTSKDGVNVQLECSGERTSAMFDAVLVAIGRRPNTDYVGLEHLGISVDSDGLLVVDQQQRSTDKRVFAIGDIVPGPMLAHKASYEGRIAAEAVAGLGTANQARVIPQVVYCEPEIAWIGDTESELRTTEVEFEVAKFPWTASGRARVMECNDGMTKVLVDPLSNRILGVGIVGSHAGDLIAEAVLAMESDLEPGDLALTIHPHPTLSETLAFASEAYEGTLTELLLPKKIKW